MTTDLPISTSRSDLARLRRRIIRAYQCAQELFGKTKSASPSRMHGLMLAYDKACNQMRVDVAQASESFANTDALLGWLFADPADQVMRERDRLVLGAARYEP